MGLDTSHDCWHGAYSAFFRWRHKIAEVAGYCIWNVNYDAGIHRDTIMMEWHRYDQETHLMGEWEETPHDPLIVLFAHSDCEGLIHPAQGGPLADALEKLLPKLEEEGDGGGHIGSFREKTQTFIDGLRRACAAGEDVEFH